MHLTLPILGLDLEQHKSTEVSNICQHSQRSPGAVRVMRVQGSTKGQCKDNKGSIWSGQPGCRRAFEAVAVAEVQNLRCSGMLSE